MLEEIIDLFRNIENDDNESQQEDGKEKSPQELFYDVFVNRFHNLVINFFTIRFFQSEKVPSSIFLLASFISHM